MNDRSTFLENISESLNRPLKTKDDVLHSIKQYKARKNGSNKDETNSVNLVDQFKNVIALNGGNCVYISKTELPNWLANFCSENNVKKVSLANDKRLYENEIDVLLDEIGVEIVEWKRSEEDSIEKIKGTNIGFTWTDGGYSDTGTVMQLNKKGSGRLVSLLPDIHIAFMNESDLHSHLSSAMNVLGKLSDKDELPNYINFISGPSSSADIQMQVVLGVHGPKTFCTVILKNE